MELLAVDSRAPVGEEGALAGTWVDSLRPEKLDGMGALQVLTEGSCPPQTGLMKLSYQGP